MSSVLCQSLPLFDGFPYLITRVAGAMYHVILLPADAEEPELVSVARCQALTNQLPSSLVLANDRAVYCSPEDDVFVSEEPPLGGLIVAGHLIPAIEFNDSSDEFRARQAKLEAVVERTRGRGFALGDPTKGGHPANDKERRRLGGFLPDGTPKGLNRCGACGGWKGECLDPSEQFAGQVMAVHCHCENRNRCARCNAHLYERRLNANYYSSTDRTIWHVPGFCGFGHRCSAAVLARMSA